MIAAIFKSYSNWKSSIQLYKGSRTWLNDYPIYFCVRKLGRLIPNYPYPPSIKRKFISISWKLSEVSKARSRRQGGQRENVKCSILRLNRARWREGDSALATVLRQAPPRSKGMNFNCIPRVFSSFFHFLLFFLFLLERITRCLKLKTDACASSSM